MPALALAPCWAFSCFDGGTEVSNPRWHFSNAINPNLDAASRAHDADRAFQRPGGIEDEPDAS